MPHSVRTAALSLCYSLLGGALLIAFTAPLPAHGQADTTATAPADTAASSTTAPADTTDADTPSSTSLLQLPVPFPSRSRGTPVVDSLPALTPHTDLAHVLAQQPGSFLYDLGAAGWPHGWSPSGLGPHRSRLWIEGRPYQNPLTGRARFDLLPLAFLTPPRIGVDPGGSGVGVHTAWRDYDQRRPLTELRYQRDTNGLNAIAVSHSQMHRLSLFGAPGRLHTTLGYGGRGTGGLYAGDDLRRERQLWGRLRYQREAWAVEISNISSRRRLGAHSGVLPPSDTPFSAIYRLPFCNTCSQTPNASRRTFRNDLTTRLQAPLVPGTDAPTTLSATWTSNTFDFDPEADTTWSVVLNGGHGLIRQPLQIGRHALTLEAQGQLWGIERSNVASVAGRRWSAHATARDSVQVGATHVVADAGWHATPDQQYPSASLQLRRPLGPLTVFTDLEATGQRRSWFETSGFPGFVRPLNDTAPTSVGRVLRGRLGARYQAGSIDLSVEGFAHQIRNAVDLYAPAPGFEQRLASSDSVVARRTDSPVRRAGATVTVGWRRTATRGLYATGTGTTVTTLNDDASALHDRLARTVPRAHGRARIGARFVLFTDLRTDLALQARGWTSMNSRWFHPPTGRLVVPPANEPVPVLGAQQRVGPSGTVDLQAEMKLRGATLFLTLEHVLSSFAPPDSFEGRATIEPGTFVVPLYPLPARQFRFGVHWPIFD